MESMNVDIREYKALINEEMLVVMRQMDSASKILGYLYLGSEWNASNLEELQENRFNALHCSNTSHDLSRQKGKLSVEIDDRDTLSLFIGVAICNLRSDQVKNLTIFVYLAYRRSDTDWNITILILAG